MLDRILNRRRPEHAAVEVNNLFARAVRVRSVSDEEVKAVFDRYGIDVRQGQPEARQKLYRDYLFYCLSDRHLSDEELSDLEHLRRVLQLEPTSVELVHRRVAREVYSRGVDEVLADATIDENERRFLSNLREQLAIPHGIADNIVEVKQRQRDRSLP